MTHPDTSIDCSTQLWGPDFFPEGLLFVDDTVESLEINNRQSPDTDLNNRYPSPRTDMTDPVLKPRKRGRPRVLDDDGSDAVTKERRKIQLRIAQRAYRSRKEERIATLSKKVAELEQKLLIYRTLYLGTRSATVGSTGFPIEWATPPEVMAEFEAQALVSSVEAQSNAFIPDPDASGIRGRNNGLHQHLSPSVPIPTRPSYMIMDDGSGYEDWPLPNDVPMFPFP